ncbi:transposase [Streptomyces sp. NPDC059101]|uniref:transposase n=1 Tax=Streptomyces sp. NPDC059101 TaxID=3346728 RepID=UPI0036B06CBE
MGSGRWGWIVPDGLWEIARPLLPPARVRPQGGGVANIDDEAVFAAIIYVLVSGCAWRALPPCFARHDPHRGRYFKPQRLHADKAYDIPHLRKWLRGKRIGVRIARKGIESSKRLGRRRWVIERTISWLTGYRRLSPRYERDPRNYLAFLGLAAALCCYKRLIRLTT